MKICCKNCHDEWEIRDRTCLKCGGIMEGVTGPERHLVGEARSDGPASEPEKRSGERRGVGKIVELSELLRLIDEDMEEAMRNYDSAEADGDDEDVCYYSGKQAALANLRLGTDRIAVERSDHPNDQTESPNP